MAGACGACALCDDIEETVDERLELRECTTGVGALPRVAGALTSLATLLVSGLRVGGAGGGWRGCGGIAGACPLPEERDDSLRLSLCDATSGALLRSFSGCA